MKKLVLSEKAKNQLINIFEYIEAKWSERVRKKVSSKIFKTFVIIEKSPDSFPDSTFNKNLRKCVVLKQTTIFYKIIKDEIVVVSVFDTRQNPKKIKKIK